MTETEKYTQKEEAKWPVITALEAFRDAAQSYGMDAGSIRSELDDMIFEVLGETE